MHAARALWRTLEAIHASIYFSPLAMDAYAEIGVGDGGFNYFAPRSAAMGPADGLVVAAAFYFWEPSVVQRFLPAAWEKASPEMVVETRWGIAPEVVRDRAGDVVTLDAATEAAGLLAKAMSGIPVSGRPVYGGHASVAAPDDPVATVWHWATLYREYRGDGHVAALQTLGLGPVEALILNVATGYWEESRQRRSRGWSEDVWDAKRALLAEGGLIDVGEGLSLTPTGQALVDEVEQLTNQLSAAPWARLGEEGTGRVVDLLEPWAEAIDAAGGVGYNRPTS